MLLLLALQGFCQVFVGCLPGVWLVATGLVAVCMPIAAACSGHAHAGLALCHLVFMHHY
jgi:hypothetical protein